MSAIGVFVQIVPHSVSLGAAFHPRGLYETRIGIDFTEGHRPFVGYLRRSGSPRSTTSVAGGRRDCMGSSGGRQASLSTTVAMSQVVPPAVATPAFGVCLLYTSDAADEED